MIGPELDIRDQFMGLRNLRKPFVAVPLGMRDATGAHIPFTERAKKATEFLATQIWGDTRTHATKLEAQTRPPNEQIVTKNLWMNIDKITMEELIWAIRKLKRDKAPGPDGVPVECYKDMQEDQLQIIFDLLNKWWEGQEIESEATRAQVILIFKKGDKNNLANYRQISLLNTNYKLYTAILQKKRLADVLDPYLQNTQYGFRAHRGTLNALATLHQKNCRKTRKDRNKDTASFARLGKSI